MKNDCPSELNCGLSFDLQETSPKEIVDNYIRLIEPANEDSPSAEDTHMEPRLQNSIEKAAFLDSDWHH